MGKCRVHHSLLLGGILAFQASVPSAQKGGPDETLQDYVEVVPGTAVKFKMIAIKGGKLGGAGKEPVSVEPFWMGETEVTWNEYEEFYFGGVRPTVSVETKARVDAVSRPTPPYGAPDRGWGTGWRPAMSMTFHAANVYCQWLSALTGRRYRLPTQKEWEYACRAGQDSVSTESPAIDQYAWHQSNSRRRSNPVATKSANPWGLFDTLGNVAELCQQESTSFDQEKAKTSPESPAIRGGSFRDAAGSLSCKSPSRLDEKACLKTDPNAPKSIWWYSDCFHVGIRVARSDE